MRSTRKRLKIAWAVEILTRLQEVGPCVSERLLVSDAWPKRWLERFCLWVMLPELQNFGYVERTPFMHFGDKEQDILEASEYELTVAGLNFLKSHNVPIKNRDL